MLRIWKEKLGGQVLVGFGPPTQDFAGKELIEKTGLFLDHFYTDFSVLRMKGQVGFA